MVELKRKTFSLLGKVASEILIVFGIPFSICLAILQKNLFGEFFISERYVTIFPLN